LLLPPVPQRITPCHQPLTSTRPPYRTVLSFSPFSVVGTMGVDFNARTMARAMRPLPTFMSPTRHTCTCLPCYPPAPYRCTPPPDWWCARIFMQHAACCNTTASPYRLGGAVRATRNIVTATGCTRHRIAVGRTAPLLRPSASPPFSLAIKRAAGKPRLPTLPTRNVYACHGGSSDCLPAGLPPLSLYACWC